MAREMEGGNNIDSEKGAKLKSRRLQMISTLYKVYTAVLTERLRLEVEGKE